MKRLFTINDKLLLSSELYDCLQKSGIYKEITIFFPKCDSNFYYKQTINYETVLSEENVELYVQLPDNSFHSVNLQEGYSGIFEKHKWIKIKHLDFDYLEDSKSIWKISRFIDHNLAGMTLGEIEENNLTNVLKFKPGWLLNDVTGKIEFTLKGWLRGYTPSYITVTQVEP